jgi:hypothetical protein
LLRSQASLHKPEVDEFLAWLHTEAKDGEGQSVLPLSQETKTG